MIYYFIFRVGVGSDLSIFKIYKDEAEDLNQLASRVISVLRTEYFSLFNSYILDNLKVNIPNNDVYLVGFLDEGFQYTSLLDSFNDYHFTFDSIDNFKSLNNSYFKKGDEDALQKD